MNLRKDRPSGLIDQYGNPLTRNRSEYRAGAVRASGYGNGITNPESRAIKGWNYSGGSADDDIIEHLTTLRQMSRDLVMNSPIGAALMNILTVNVVGRGIVPEPTPDDWLQLSEEQTERFKQEVETQWSLFAESPNCDAFRRDNFYELTQLVNRSVDESGDIFVLLPMTERPGCALDLRIQAIEADYVCDPSPFPVHDPHADIYGGVELDEAGAVAAYHLCTQHPLGKRQRPGIERKWRRIPAYGEQTGRQNILHLMHSERPSQRRGIPLLAPVIQQIKLLDRYISSEALAAAIQAQFTVVVTSERPDLAAMEGSAAFEDQREQYELSDDEIALGPGIVQYANPGEDIKPIQPTRPYSAFTSFVDTSLRMIGAATGIPYELLTMTFNSSYSASRAAMNVATAFFKVRREWLVNDFCKPVYAAFMDEAVARGLIYAPGYWEHPQARRAYQKADWHGSAYPQINQVEEIKAAIERAKYGVSTWPEITSELTGGDWRQNIAQMGRDLSYAGQHGVSLSEEEKGVKDETQDA